jgi:protein SCO1
MNHPAKLSLLRYFLAGLAVVTLAGCDLVADEQTHAEPPLEGADIGGDFELVDANGNAVKWSDFAGKYRVVYFGYAFCPDICPNDMARLARGLDALEKTDPDKAGKIQPIFITIDPERDTPAVVGEFTRAFSDDFIGLTGTPEQVRAAGDTFRVYYERGEEVNGGAYLMNHSNIAYLFAPDGKPIATLPTDRGGDAVAEELRRWVK